jgi:NADH-quinone oxidoreductase subunit A
MFPLVGYALLFIVIGAGFIFIHLVLGKLIRPSRPNAEKEAIYECGEPTIGSAWVQFDLRYYVVALLFVIFDVEVAFFFPWAVVFGQTNAVANESLSIEQRAQAYLDLVPDRPENLRLPAGSPEYQAQSKRNEIARLLKEDSPGAKEELQQELAGAVAPAQSLGWIALVDILVFFGVLLVGFAYLWKRGDLAWVRSTLAETPSPTAPPGPTVREEKQLASVG